MQAGNTALVKVGDDGTRSLTKVGKAAAGIAGVAIVAGIIETVATISNSINQIEKKGTAAFDGFRGAINGTSADLADAFSALVELEDESAEFAGIWEGFGAEIQLGDFKADVEEVQAAFTKVLDTFGPEAAQKTIDGLRKQNDALDKNSDQYRTNADFIAENQKVVDKRRTALTQATVAEREQKSATQEAVEAYDRQTASVEGINQTIKDYNDNLTLLTAEYDAAQAGAKKFGDQIERATSIDNIAGAVVKLGDAVRSLDVDLTALPSFEVALDPTRISEDAGKAVDALIQFGGAAQTYFQQVIGAGGADLVPALAEKYRTILTTALQNAGVNPADIPNFLKLAGLDEQSITVAVKFAKDQASLDELQVSLQVFAAGLNNDPKATAFIKAAIAQGDFAGAAAFIRIWAAQNPIPVPVIPTPGTGGSYTVTVTPGVNSSGGTSGNQRTPRGRRVGAPSSEAPSPPSASLPPGRALGGPLAKGQMSYVNEMGAELFVPTSSGFVMDSDDSKALVRGVEAMLAGGGGYTFNITTSDPQLVATEVVRKQRDAAYLIGR